MFWRKRATRFRELVETAPEIAGYLVSDAVADGRPPGAPRSAALFADAWCAVEALAHGGFSELLADHAGTLPRLRDALVGLGLGTVVELVDAATRDDADLDDLSARFWSLDNAPQRLLIDHLLAREEAWFDVAASHWRRDNPQVELGVERALESAILYAHVELLRRAIARGASLTRTSEYSPPALIQAIRPGRDRVALVTALLELGAPLDATDSLRRSPLHAAADDGAHLTRLLLARGADPHARDRHGTTPLHVAADAETARALLAAGADPRARTHLGSEPLHLARTAGIVEALLAAGADVSARTPDGRTVLHWVAEDRHDVDEATVRALLAAGADPHAIDARGATPLHGAHAATVHALIEAGIPVDARDHLGRTPLMTIHSADAVRALFAHGARPDAVDAAGRNALHHPRLQDGVVDALVTGGVSLEALDQRGQTPLARAVGARTRTEAVVDEGDHCSEGWVTALEAATRGSS